jgi:DNA-binding transcriptional regulator YhcF (GntR family)
MKSPIRKAAPGKRRDTKSRKILPKRRPAGRGDQRMHPVRRGSMHQRRGESLGDFAYRTMREAIRSGKFKSGEHLREADVAKWLNISRTPVREAFHRIISEGLLTNGPWNGVMVADLDAQQLVQLYAVRAALEGTAAALAAQHATKAEVQRLFQIAKSEARAKNDPAKLVIINSELHQTLYCVTRPLSCPAALNWRTANISKSSPPFAIARLRKPSGLRGSTSIMPWPCGSSYSAYAPVVLEEPTR